jgi:hypothetical protein
LKVFRESGLQLAKKVKLKADLGYQGIKLNHARAVTPIKKPKNGDLNKKEKKWNKKFRRKRIKVEDVIRRCKVFRIVKERFRNKGNKLQEIWSVVCGIVNLKT